VRELGDDEARPAMAELHRLGAACGGGEREANGAGECVGQALAFFWSSNARRGNFGRACAPRGEQLLRRSATTSSYRFLKIAIQCSMTTPDSATSTIRNSQTVAIRFMV